jgi:hypothetical protein
MAWAPTCKIYSQTPVTKSIPTEYAPYLLREESPVVEDVTACFRPHGCEGSAGASSTCR